ncbi:MAG: glycerol-3-phosphate 1-O-acyltransferase [Deltaproteobacteria bacterium]|nr:glycerol-3-phosphate 1-O-acyltransferase [Deltaproteobacteria bacterium]MBW2420158.1 glycerol-3-phosphate 1-O-acyltransferase [Deltaproteobacteria bacterium]
MSHSNTPGASSTREPQESGWPCAPESRVTFLVDASSRLEARLLRSWIERQCPESVDPTQVEVIRLPASRRRRRGRLDPRLEPALATDDDPVLAPLRVAWLPREKDGRRAARFSDLHLGDPRDPGRLRERWVLRREPDRCRIVVAEPAPVSELRSRWGAAAGGDVAQTVGIAEFTARQAALALDRAERRLRGARYKVPRFVAEDIVSRPAFRGGLAKLARELGRSEGRVERDASRYLKEIAATHSPFMIDLFTEMCHNSFSRGYGELRYDQNRIEELRALAQNHPLVFLPTHKSNLDHAVLRYLLHDQGLPPNHTAGGKNMDFFPIGSMVRRSGIFFIRRTFKDNETYKFVLHQYIDFLIEKRFPLEWYIEGGRSRSGKLLPPKFGLLNYVVDAYRREKSEDVILVPVSIAYDRISDVSDYASEQLGGPKERESLGWFIRFLRRLGSHYGNIDVRFGELLSLRKEIGPPENREHVGPDGPDLAIQKLAFGVCDRINRVTPATPTSLAMLALLGRGDRALSLAEIGEALAELVEYVELRGLPTTEPVALSGEGELREILDPLVTGGVLTRFDEGPETVYAIGPNQHLAAAYYRNTVIHFFVDTAIAELALLRAREVESADRRGEFWQEVMRLRDLLKFEFFFAEKPVFQGEIRRELAIHAPRWEEEHLGDSDSLRELMARIRPLHAHRFLRSFLESYAVVADQLVGLGSGALEDEGRFLRECLALGRQYELQRRIRSPESVSKVLFANALRLAGNRKLLQGEPEQLDQGRRAFAQEIRRVVRRVDAIEALAAARTAGVSL